eukprot:scaffold668_cov148-Isochrysis_galbana.AAC.2
MRDSCATTDRDSHQETYSEPPGAGRSAERRRPPPTPFARGPRYTDLASECVTPSFPHDHSSQPGSAPSLRKTKAPHCLPCWLTTPTH